MDSVKHKLYLPDIIDLGRSENCSLVSITHKPPMEKMLSGLPIKYSMILTYPAGSNTDNPSGLEKKIFKPHQHLVKL